ncbi:N-acetylmuramoyl-L-alanine amidase [Xanthovirga aplysinae]|uniref:N-acetylmuramoyl-L-alanine amidase n=1 Tax=Xanthovirga aplysinae TaxID=2529853 RepID=UPI001FE97338|nr:N-acetylmuramoyl-L-alanine amidase [Xanthovirga aplysinae]
MDIGTAEIDQWHKERGWRCIGYHYVIRRDGTIEVGRTEDNQGAHCKGQNRNSIGICWVGGKGEDNRTKAQTESLKKLLKSLRARYKGITIHGHNQFSEKTCPNFDVKEFLKNEVLV